MAKAQKKAEEVAKTDPAKAKEMIKAAGEAVKASLKEDLTKKED